MVITTLRKWQSLLNRAVKLVNNVRIIFFVFNCYLAAPQPTLGHYRGGSLTHPMLITCVLHIWPEGHREPRNKVGSLSPVERLVGFEPGTFRFWSKPLNPLGHSPQNRPFDTDSALFFRSTIISPRNRECKCLLQMGFFNQAASLISGQCAVHLFLYLVRFPVGSENGAKAFI